MCRFYATVQLQFAGMDWEYYVSISPRDLGKLDSSADRVITSEGGARYRQPWQSRGGWAEVLPWEDNEECVSCVGTN